MKPGPDQIMITHTLIKLHVDLGAQVKILGTPVVGKKQCMKSEKKEWPATFHACERHGGLTANARKPTGPFVFSKIIVVLLK